MRFTISLAALAIGAVAIPQGDYQPISQISDGQIQAPPATEVPVASSAPAASVPAASTPAASAPAVSTPAVSAPEVVSSVASAISSAVESGPAAVPSVTEGKSQQAQPLFHPMQ